MARHIEHSDPSANQQKGFLYVGLSFSPSKVQTMLELHKRLAKVKTPRSRERLQRQIAATDRAIDNLVYELYDLTDEEIAIVEEATEQG